MSSFKRLSELPLSGRLAVKVIAGLILGVLAVLAAIVFMIGAFWVWRWALEWATDDPALALLGAVIFAPVTTLSVFGSIYLCVADEFAGSGGDG